MKNKVFFAIAFIASIVTGVVICKKKGKIVFGENSKQSQKKDATVDTMGKSIVLYTNMNQMKAILHNKALLYFTDNNYQYDKIVIDQFEPPKSFYNHIKDAPKKISNVTFLTKAEDECLSVAVSSMISRYVFLKEMNKLEQEYGVTFPKGAGDIVDKTGKELVAKYGKDVLYKVSKLNFKNTTKILQ